MTANVRRKARNTALDVSTDGVSWLRVPGRVDQNPAITPNKVDSTDYDTNGWGSMEITLQNGVITLKYNSIINGGVPNPAQELIEGCEGEFDDAARLFTRYYDTDGGTRGRTGLAIVEVVPASTGVADLRAITATLTFDGEATKMSPSDITAAIGNADLPVILSATPTAVAVGHIVKIIGQHFSSIDPTHAATAVKFGGTNATDYTVVSDSVISAVMPAGSAGSAVVLVTNATGPNSPAFPYTRGA